MIRRSLLWIAGVVVLIRPADAGKHPVCDATRQNFLNTGCCGDSGDVTVCVAPNIMNTGFASSSSMAPRIQEIRAMMRNTFGESFLDQVSLSGVNLTVFHSAYAYDRMRTEEGYEAGFVPEVLHWLHAITGASIRLVNEWRSPETDVNGDSDIFLGWKDIIPNRFPSRAPHLASFGHVAPSGAMRHYLIIRKTDRARFAELLSPLLDATPYERAKALHTNGLRVTTCNCEQYDLWQDPEFGFGNFTVDNSVIFGALGQPGIYDYTAQWATRTAACTLEEPDCADWTFTSDHRDPYYAKRLYPDTLEILEIEMADPSSQWIFYNKDKPHATKLELALSAVVKSGLYDYTHTRWKNIYTRSGEKESGYGNALANQARGRIANEASRISTDNTTSAMDLSVNIHTETVSMGTALYAGADLPSTRYDLWLGGGVSLEGFVERFPRGGGATAVGPPSVAAPPPPPLPPRPPYAAPSPGEFCVECNFGAFETGDGDPFG